MGDGHWAAVEGGGGVWEPSCGLRVGSPGPALSSRKGPRGRASLISCRFFSFGGRPCGEGGADIAFSCLILVHPARWSGSAGAALLLTRRLTPCCCAWVPVATRPSAQRPGHTLWVSRGTQGHIDGPQPGHPTPGACPLGPRGFPVRPARPWPGSRSDFRPRG